MKPRREELAFSKGNSKSRMHAKTKKYKKEKFIEISLIGPDRQVTPNASKTCVSMRMLLGTALFPFFL